MLKLRSRSHSLSPAELERPHFPEQGQDTYNDSYYFTAHGQDGSALITRLGFRADGKNEQWFILISADGVEYRVDESAVAPPADHTSGNLRYLCLNPGSSWEIRYDGPLVSGGKSVEGSFKGIFSSDLPIFDFGTDMPPGPMAEAMAGHDWSKEWFEKLKGYSQVHYEQGGSLRGELKAGDERAFFDFPSVRDHSFGPREWGFMDRHAWITAVLDDGRYFNLSLVDYPILRGIAAGYLAEAPREQTGTAPQRGAPKRTAPGRYQPLRGFPVLDDLFVDGGVPESVTFTVSRERSRTVQVKVYGERGYTWTMGGDYSLTERISRFEIDGVPGRGILEFGRRPLSSAAPSASRRTYSSSRSIIRFVRSVLFRIISGSSPRTF